MSKRPDHLRPITVEIPVTWTAEQALAVWEMLDELRAKIWARYSCQLPTARPACRAAARPRRGQR
jgi:hypothetical protein